MGSNRREGAWAGWHVISTELCNNFRALGQVGASGGVHAVIVSIPIPVVALVHRNSV